MVSESKHVSENVCEVESECIIDSGRTVPDSDSTKVSPSSIATGRIMAHKGDVAHVHMHASSSMRSRSLFSLFKSQKKPARIVKKEGTRAPALQTEKYKTKSATRH